MLSREDLDHRAAVAAAARIELSAGCHPGGRLWAAYDAAAGVVVLSCGCCRRIVAEVEVAWADRAPAA